MIIIGSVPSEGGLSNLYTTTLPDQHVTEAEKQEESFVKNTMDYFSNIAALQRAENEEYIVPNYELFKGKLRPSDFYEEDVKPFTAALADSKLPVYVKNYSILSSPINTLIGEMTDKPDNTFVKDFGDHGQNEEEKFKTSLLQEVFAMSAMETLMSELARKGQPIPEDEYVRDYTEKEIEKELTNFVSMTERWGSKTLEALKIDLEMKEKSEEGFADLLKVGQEYLHIYEDNSERGFTACLENPAKVWKIMSTDKRYTANPFDSNGTYATGAGTIDEMTLTEILQVFKLPISEIDYLRKQAKEGANGTQSPESIFDRSKRSGESTISYIQDNHTTLSEEFLNGKGTTGYTGSVDPNGYLFTVVRAYWPSKKKIGKLVYIDDIGVEQEIIIDESYTEGDHPGEVSVDWAWVNQWYQGIKIGTDIYDIKPLEILDYCPIIGTLFGTKNYGRPVSLLDEMKKFQTMYNIFTNKLFELVQKNKGKQFIITTRQIPTAKDGDDQDALEQWEMMQYEKGLLVVEDDPENATQPSNFNQHRVVDMSLQSEMQGYYNLAKLVKNECYELLGINGQRQGAVSNSATAYGTNAAITQSFAQTRPYFSAHENLVNKWYQAIIDAAKNIESRKPFSKLHHINTEGDKKMLEISGRDLTLAKLMVFVTNRVEDARTFMEFRQLAQSMVQSGTATGHEVISLYTTKSIRQIQDLFLKNQARLEEERRIQQEQKQQEITQSQEQFNIAQQIAILEKEKQRENDNINKQLDRISKEKVAAITASGQQGRGDADKNGDGIPDVYQVEKLNQASTKLENDLAASNALLAQKQNDILFKQQHQTKELLLRDKELDAARERTAAMERIAKLKNSTKNTGKKK